MRLSAALISVLLPAPLGPTMAISTPSGTDRSTSQMAGLLLYATVRSSMTRAGGVSGFG
ncbi:MAG: hypothetical protein R2856_14195 [Caldilineaceae bacterium]